MVTTTSITAVSVSMRNAQSSDEVADVDALRPTCDGDARAASPQADDWRERRTRTADRRRRTAGAVVTAHRDGARPECAAEQAGDERADSGQEDDGADTSRAQPFIMLMSSTAM